MAAAVKAGGTAAAPPPSKRKRRLPWIALVFLAPALILLGALVLYPIVFTVIRSMYDAPGNSFVGFDNYRDMFSSTRTLNAIKNNAIWVVVAPTIATILGLIFAVLTERVRWATAFKVAVFMPMAISLLASGVIWRIVYEKDPDVGLANAATKGVVEVLRPPGSYPGARPSEPEVLRADGEAYVTQQTYLPGDTASLGLIAVSQGLIPAEAQSAEAPVARSDLVSGTVWLDFTRGGGGERGVIDGTELGLPGMVVEAVSGDNVLASARTDERGNFDIAGITSPVALRLTEANFRAPFGGITWLGPTLVTPAIIVSFLWIWAGFAMVVIGAGLAAIPREVLEAARVDGAKETEVFRRVTVPLLMPVLLVVVVTLAINVLKIFDLVFVVAPGSVQDDANVLALEMYRVSFGGSLDQGLGSALAVLLFLLVIPAMAFNLKRFKGER